MEEGGTKDRGLARDLEYIAAFSGDGMMEEIQIEWFDINFMTPELQL